MLLKDNDKNNLFLIAFNLIITCIVSGVIIACTYLITAPTAEKERVKLKNDTMKSLVKDVENFQPIAGKEGWFTAKKDNQIVAYIVPEEGKGYGGTIKLLVAVTPSGKVLQFGILAMNETPGLGDKSSKDPFRNQFVGKDPLHLKVVKDPSDKEDIQAITGATISSRAVTDIVKRAVEQVIQYIGG